MALPISSKRNNGNNWNWLQLGLFFYPYLMLITDQQSIAFILDQKKREAKLQKTKIQTVLLLAKLNAKISNFLPIPNAKIKTTQTGITCHKPGLNKSKKLVVEISVKQALLLCSVCLVFLVLFTQHVVLNLLLKNSNFLHLCWIAMSRTTPYYLTRNSKNKRWNQNFWRTIKLMLYSKQIPEAWETALENALHSTISVLCTWINSTPHEQLEKLMPNWILNHGVVFLRNHMQTKSDPLCCEVELVKNNFSFAHMHFSDGQETTVY